MIRSSKGLAIRQNTLAIGPTVTTRSTQLNPPAFYKHVMRRYLTCLWREYSADLACRRAVQYWSQLRRNGLEVRPTDDVTYIVTNLNNVAAKTFSRGYAHDSTRRESGYSRAPAGSSRLAMIHTRRRLGHTR